MPRTFALAMLLTLTLPSSFVHSAQAEDPVVPGTKRKVSEWTKQLGEDKNPKARLKALLALEVAGPRIKSVLPAICQALKKDEDADVRVAAAQVLERLRQAAEDAKIDLKDVVECLKDSLAQDKNERVREAAASTLGRMGLDARPALPALMAALKDRGPAVQKAAAESIDRLGDDATRALAAMMDLLKDTRADVLARRSAASFVGRFADADVAVPALVEVLKAEPPAPARLRRIVLEMLGRAGQAAELAVPLMIRGLEDKDTEVRIAAATALVHVGPPAAAALPALRKALKDDDKYVRGQALEAIGKLGPAAAGAVADVISCLKNEKVLDVRVAAMRALGELGPVAREATSLLADAARSSQPEIREAALDALKKIRGS